MRPTPEELLERVHREEDEKKRGRLTVFFGAAPGVGKTYAMLESARLEREEGRDVVVGVVETHGRYDTGALLLGLEILPRRKIEHEGIRLEELDLDGALARRPGVVLVDELAHTNAPGSRHAKRWQDIDELLDAGIDVYTTLNVQHLQSQGDLVAQITHVVVRETVPDAVFEKAADVRLIDLPIDELLERLREGRVYVPEQARVARESFFREGNLIALRELALRLTAQRVDAQMRRYRQEHGILSTWPVGDRLLVCVSPSPASEHLLRATRRLAMSVHAEWIVAYVETPASLRLSAKERERIAAHLQLAQSLGAEAVTLSGAHGPTEIVRFARSRNVSRIVVGKPTHARWRDRIGVSFLDDVVRSSGEIEVHVSSGEGARKPRDRDLTPSPRRTREPAGYVAGASAVLAATLLGLYVFGVEQLADVVMIYVLGVVLVSLRWGLRPSLFAAVLGVLAFDFFFVPPYHTFAVADLRHVTTFAVMFLVATVISGLTRRVRDQADAAREREMRTASLYALSRALSAATSARDVATVGTKHLHDVFGVHARVLVKERAGGLLSTGDGPFTFDLDDKELGVAAWAAQHGRAAGAGTDTLPAARATYLPLEASGKRVGVLGFRTSGEGAASLASDRRQHLETFAGQIAGALDRLRLAEEAREALLRVEAEQLRNSLLSSVSHDLRTPLAVITGTAGTLLDTRLDDAVRKDLTESIVTEAERLNRLVRNLLDMTRLEAGAVKVRKEWQPLEETFGAALERTETFLGARPVTTRLPDDLPLVPYDSILLQQVLVNLLENAAKYTPPDAAIELAAARAGDSVEVVVSDRGPGLPSGEETKVFDKFYRAAKGTGGVGLGLTICRGIVEAHGGRIWAENREGGGVAFHFTLPMDGEPPSMETAA